MSLRTTTGNTATSAVIMRNNCESKDGTPLIGAITFSISGAAIHAALDQPDTLIGINPYIICSTGAFATVTQVRWSCMLVAGTLTMPVAEQSDDDDYELFLATKRARKQALAKSALRYEHFDQKSRDDSPTRASATMPIVNQQAPVESKEPRPSSANERAAAVHPVKASRLGSLW